MILGSTLGSMAFYCLIALAAFNAITIATKNRGYEKAAWGVAVLPFLLFALFMMYSMSQAKSPAESSTRASLPGWYCIDFTTEDGQLVPRMICSDTNQNCVALSTEAFAEADKVSDCSLSAVDEAFCTSLVEGGKENALCSSSLDVCKKMAGNVEATTGLTPPDCVVTKASLW